MRSTTWTCGSAIGFTCGRATRRLRPRRSKSWRVTRTTKSMGRRERYLVGLDVGTSKVAAIVGEVMDDGGVDIIGIGLADSRGIRRGIVVNLEAAVESIKKAIE